MENNKVSSEESFIKLVRSNTYDLYRNAPVGIAMFDALYDLVRRKKLTPNQALIVVTQFDLSVMKVMSSFYDDPLIQEGFSFDGYLRSYRIFQVDGWVEILLQNVRVYQHLCPKTVQYKLLMSGQSCPRAKNIKTFERQCESNNVIGMIEEVPEMVIIAKRTVQIPMNKIYHDPVKGRCHIEETFTNTHPRIKFYHLIPIRDKEDAHDHDDHLVESEAPILNRFRDSNMFTVPNKTFSTPSAIKMHHFKQQGTSNPKLRLKNTFVNSFAPSMKIHKSSLNQEKKRE